MMFECKICLERHASLIDLEHHWGVHFKDILCEQCDFAFSTSDSLDHHLKAVHDKIRDLPSSMYVEEPQLPKDRSAPAIGSQTFAHRDFEPVFALGMTKNVKLVHSENNAFKSIANHEKHSIAEGFGTSDSLNRNSKAVCNQIEDLPPLIHIEDHCLPKKGSAAATGLQACAQSDFESVSTFGRKNHVDHPENIEELDVGNSTIRNFAVNNEKDSVPAVNNSGPITLLECSQCNHKTTSTKKLRQHMEKSHNKNIHFCDHCKFRTNLLGRLTFHKWQIHPTEQCTRCSYATNKKMSLATHLRTVHSVEEGLCPECDYASSDSVKLDLHIVNKHLKIKNKLCTHCDYATNNSLHLAFHIKSVHGKIRDNLCEQCDYACSTTYLLNRHVKTVHNKIKDLKCQHCDKAFSQNSALVTHMEAVHDKIKDKRCPHCSYSSHQSSTMAIHIKAVHDKIKDNLCQQCDKAYSQNSNLTKHIKTIHDKIKDHRCPHCNFSSSRKGNLAVHIKAVHFKIRDHICLHCGRTFSATSVLARHIKKFHEEINDQIPPNASNSASAPLDLSCKPNNSKIVEEIDSGYKSDAT